MLRSTRFLRTLDWFLCAVLVLGAAIRFVGIGRGLPYTYDADEPSYIIIGLQMIQRGDLNPHWWLYPSLMFDLIAVVFLGYYGFGRINGTFASTTNLLPPEIVGMGIGRLALPAELALARGTVALFSTACILIVYLIASRISPNRWAARLSALLFALAPTVVGLSARLAPDVFAMFFVLLSVLFSLAIVDGGSWKETALAGATAGLAIAAKYNAAVVLIAPALALLLRYGPAVWRERNVYLCVLASAVGFFIAVPYAVLDFANFWQGATWQVFSYTTEGHVGQEGNSLAWYVNYLLQTEGWVAVAALVGIAFCLVRRRPKYLVLLSFPTLYFVVVSMMLIRNSRTIMLIVPLLDLFAGYALVVAADWFRTRFAPQRNLAVAGSVLVALAMVFPLGIQTLDSTASLFRPDPREQARQWLDANLPANSRIAQESYTPYLDTAKYGVYAVSGIIDQSPEWYEDNGFQYLVLSQGMFQRYYDDPLKYATEVGKYDGVASRFQEIKNFEGDSEIRVYKTNAHLPDHVLNVRYVSSSDLIELVGYDLPGGDWVAGQPLRITLYWRSLGEKNEPLELGLQLVGAGDARVGEVRGDLYQGQARSSGIFRTDWAVPWFSKASAGRYELEVTVTQTRYGFDVPARSFRGDPYGDLSISGLVARPVPLAAGEMTGVTPANAQWNSKIGLDGYVIPPSLHPGERVPLTFYWNVLQVPAHDYTFFAHLVDATGAVIAQVDGVPVNAAFPTSLWQAGEILRDDYSLEIPVDTTPGNYRLEIGWYDPGSLVRLPLSDPVGAPSDKWLLPAPYAITSQSK